MRGRLVTDRVGDRLRERKAGGIPTRAVRWT